LKDLAMPEYKAPLRDMQFVLHEVFAAESVWQSMPGTRDVNRELADAILEEGGKITGNLIAPLNRPGDEEGVHWNNGVVTTPAGYRDAFKIFAEGAWVGLAGNPEYGGQGMPKMLTILFEEMLHAASNAFCLYSILTSGAALAIDAHASEELKQTYLPKMYSGEWTGAMCLTESHAGTDLGIIRTKAEPQADGSYAISGTKIFITGGDHDLVDNIIHLVLAKLPDAPAGSKGISLFIVPKNIVNEDGSVGANNGVSCGSIEHKMGINASATCVMNFDGAKGYLVGEINKGLAGMFTMMNYERLSVGIQGLGCSEISYQGAVRYARDRLQSRAPTGAVNKAAVADPIIVHPDVRRMLMTQRAFIEAGRAFAVYTGMQLDISKFGEGEAQQRAEALVALLTPVAKAFMTDKGLDCCVLGQQVFGGHGYIREWGMEQLVRDVRIAQIYEGTNGIQALDLMGRKVASNGGAYVKLFAEDVDNFLAGTKSWPELAEFSAALIRSRDTLLKVTQWVVEAARGDGNAVGAASVEYLHLFGYTAYAFMWARMAAVAVQHPGDTFYTNKLLTGRFFLARLLPQIESLRESIMNGSDTTMALSAEHF
jgi:alkylation response protein AidB-like acyl-CoA dehydrogenase